MHEDRSPDAAEVKTRRDDGTSRLRIEIRAGVGEIQAWLDSDETDPAPVSFGLPLPLERDAVAEARVEISGAVEVDPGALVGDLARIASGSVTIELDGGAPGELPSPAPSEWYRAATAAGFGVELHPLAVDRFTLRGHPGGNADTDETGAGVLLRRVPEVDSEPTGSDGASQGGKSVYYILASGPEPVQVTFETETGQGLWQVIDSGIWLAPIGFQGPLDGLGPVTLAPGGSMIALSRISEPPAEPDKDARSPAREGGVEPALRVTEAKALTSEEAAALLPFDRYQRYRLLSDALQVVLPRIERPELLDLGGHPGTLNLLLGAGRATVLDVEAADVPGARAGDVRTYDLGRWSDATMVCLDVLEHLPGEDRPDFLRRLVEVQPAALLLGGPFEAEPVRAAEELLLEFYRARRGEEHRFLAEHRSLGLPDLGQTCEMLTDSGYECRVLPNGHLGRWLPMMLAQATWEAIPELRRLTQQLSRFYNRLFYGRDNREPAYRHLVVARRNGFSEGERNALSELVTTDGERIEPGGIAEVFAVAGALIQLATTEAVHERDRQLERMRASVDEIARLDAERIRLLDEAKELRRHIARLEESWPRILIRWLKRGRH